MSNVTNPIVIPISFIKSLLTASGEAVMYYVFVYCQFTLLISAIDKLAKSRFKYCGLLVAPFEIIIMRLFPLVAGYEFNLYISIIIKVSCLGWFTYFYLEYLMDNGLFNIETSTK